MACNDRTADDYLQDRKLMYEIRTSQATGAQARFMTFLQRILTLLLGSEIVYNSRSSGFIAASKAHKDLDRVKRFSSQESRTILTSEERLMEDDISRFIEAETKEMQRQGTKDTTQKEYSFLLWCLQRLEENFVRRQIPRSQSQAEEYYKAIKNLLLSINELLSRLEKVAPTAETQEKAIEQRSIAVAIVIKHFETALGKLKTFEGPSQYSLEQLNIIEKFIPQLNIMVVGEIIASFNLTMLELLRAVNHFDLFSKSDIPELSKKRGTFGEHTYCARHQRNWSNHTLEITSADHDKFLEHTECIMEFLEPWFVDTETDYFEKLTPDEKNSYPSFVFPGIRENYFLCNSKNVQESSRALGKVIDHVST